MIVSVLDKKSGAGFFSSYFFLLNHYIYSKKNNLPFFIESQNWLYKSQKGWNDYFVFQCPKKEDNSRVVGHNELCDNYSMFEYNNFSKELFVLNEETKEKINNIKNDLELPSYYDSIYIRRGDKLVRESNIVPAEKFIELLLTKSPDTKCIFLMTDDYNTFIDLENYCNNKNLQIKIITLCSPDLTGQVVYHSLLDENKTHKSLNEEYFASVLPSLKKIKSLDMMTTEEIHAHTIDLLANVEIVLNSGTCIYDLQSNVSRFIGINHVKNNAYDVKFNEKINFHWTMHPSYW